MDPDYRPLNKSEFAKHLSVAPKERVYLRKALAELVDNGELVVGKKARYYRPDGQNEPIYTGTIQFTAHKHRQSAYFVPDDPDKVIAMKHSGSDSVYVPKRSAGTAMDGDKVSVKIIRKGPPKRHHGKQHHRQKKRSLREVDDEVTEDRFRAHVVEVIERRTTTIVGTYHRHGHRAALTPEDRKLPKSFHLAEVMREAKPGDLVVAEFVSWNVEERYPVARMTEVLGPPDGAGVDMLTVIHRYRLPLAFPAECLTEAEIIDEEIAEEIISQREDWREREVFTIDPEDARDFDDAISVTELPDGKGWELAVHIADVSHYVKTGSAIDREARKRGNSVYLADRVIPMIPEKLSNGVCSLNPHVERLTHATVMEFDTQGKMKKARFVSAVIKSCRRYTYEEAFTRLMMSDEAAAAFEDPVERSVVAHLRKAWKLAALLRRNRFQDGCFDLDFPEVRVVLDANNIAFAVKKTEHDESHQLIEEFMLAANEAVARETKNEGIPSIYRIHEDPDPAKLDEFAELARSFGYLIGDPTIRSEIQKLTKAVKDKPEEQGIKLALLKSMKRAAYSHLPIGHFGLAKSDYCHFTSPIRRYADLVVHRALKKLMSKRKQPTAPLQPDKTPNEAGAAEISEHISKTERVAADAERDSQQLKMIEYLENLIRDDTEVTFEAFVYDVRAIGAFIELRDLMIKGLIRKIDLPPRDDYYFDRHNLCFVSGRGRKKRISIGQSVTVRLVRMDKGRGFLDFALLTS